MLKSRDQARERAAAMQEPIKALNLKSLTVRALKAAKITKIRQIYDRHVLAGHVKGFKEARILEIRTALAVYDLPPYDHVDGAIGHVFELGIEAGTKAGIEEGLHTGHLDGRKRCFVFANGNFKLHELSVAVVRAVAQRKKTMNLGRPELQIPELKSSVTFTLPINFATVEMAELIDTWMTQVGPLTEAARMAARITAVMHIAINEIEIEATFVANLSSGRCFLAATLPEAAE